MVIGNNARDKPAELRFCPVCGSTDIDWVGGLAILAPYSECKECGYRGIFVMGTVEFVKKVREAYHAQDSRQNVMRDV
ncbi:MAG: hypothetical protein JSV76_02335 [Candidatus Bathyarchaeota archaeon]|nr:MAG: hypothetical protein JSV76_02335 [Candidatus Bathyarchaeota archaeon]